MNFPLDSKTDRPVIILDDIFLGCTALIDTGALIPIWTKSEEAFLTMFEATFVRDNIEFKGFGGIAIGKLYRINLKLGDLLFPQMPILIYSDELLPGFFIFSSTMFSDMDYAIKNSSKTFELEPFNNQRCFNIKIKNKVLSQLL